MDETNSSLVKKADEEAQRDLDHQISMYPAGTVAAMGTWRLTAENDKQEIVNSHPNFHDVVVKVTKADLSTVHFLFSTPMGSIPNDLVAGSTAQHRCTQVIVHTSKPRGYAVGWYIVLSSN